MAGKWQVIPHPRGSTAPGSSAGQTTQGAWRQGRAQAGDPVSEAGLAIEMGDARDIGLNHPPAPDAVRDVALSAAAFEGTITDLYAPKRK